MSSLEVGNAANRSMNLWYRCKNRSASAVSTLPVQRGAWRHYTQLQPTHTHTHTHTHARAVHALCVSTEAAIWAFTLSHDSFNMPSKPTVDTKTTNVISGNAPAPPTRPRQRTLVHTRRHPQVALDRRGGEAVLAADVHELPLRHGVGVIPLRLGTGGTVTAAATAAIAGPRTTGARAC